MKPNIREPDYRRHVRHEKNCPDDAAADGTSNPALLFLINSFSLLEMVTINLKWYIRSVQSVSNINYVDKISRSIINTAQSEPEPEVMSIYFSAMTAFVLFFHVTFLLIMRQINLLYIMISLKREYNKTYPYMSQDVQQVDRMCFYSQVL